MTCVFLWYFSAMLNYANSKFKVMGEETASVRREGRSAGSSISILSDLSSSGNVQALSTGLRARVAWFAATGVLAVGIAVGEILWDGADSTDAKAERAVIIGQGVRQGLERRVEADVSRIEQGPHMEFPVPAISPGSVRGAGVVGYGTDGEASPMPLGEAKSVVAGAEGQLLTKTTVRRKESHRVSAPRPGLLRGGKKQATRRPVKGSRLPAKRQQMDAAGRPGAKPAQRSNVLRFERDVDIIQAIVK